jgi:hypothetical protein
LAIGQRTFCRTNDFWLEGRMNFLNAKDLRAKIAQSEADKASAAAKAKAAADAEHQAFIDRISKPSGLSDEQVLEKASHIIERAVSNGLTEVQVLRFPNNLCTDDGRAIDQSEEGWQGTLTGVPKELWSFYERQLKPRGYHMKYQIIDRPGGLRGDVAVFLSWT